jgi:hypothetical protein
MNTVVMKSYNPKLFKRIYIVTMTHYPSQPVCVRVFNDNQYLEALQETTRQAVIEGMKNPKNFPEFDTVTVDIPREYLK